MASNIMLVDDHILWMSQKEEKACTSIVRSLEKIAAHTLSSNSQHMAVVSPAGARAGVSARAKGGSLPIPGGSLPMPGLTAALCPAELAQHRLRGIRGEARELRGAELRGFPAAGWGSCWAQPPGRAGGRAPARPAAAAALHHGAPQRLPDQLPHQGTGPLGAGARWETQEGPSCAHRCPCAPQNSIALASIQLPPSLFASPVPPAPPADCKLQLLVFRNGKLFCSTGNSSRLADDGKRRSVATPVIYAGTCKGCVLGGCWWLGMGAPGVLSLLLQSRAISGGWLCSWRGPPGEVVTAEGWQRARVVSVPWGAGRGVCGASCPAHSVPWQTAAASGT